MPARFAYTLSSLKNTIRLVFPLGGDEDLLRLALSRWYALDFGLETRILVWSGKTFSF